MIIVELFLLDENTWNNLTVCKKWDQAKAKNVINKMFTNHIHLIYVYKYLALNNLQCLICNKAQTNQLI